MDEYLHDGWRLSFDAAATREAYTASTHGAESCTCAYCRNFVAVRDDHYAPELLTLLGQFGIDPHKETEVSEMGPVGSRKRLYSGFYHFVGAVLEDPGDRMTKFVHAETGTPWQVFFTNRRSLAFQAFGTHALVQLDFTVELPWALSPAELTSPD